MAYYFSWIYDFLCLLNPMRTVVQPLQPAQPTLFGASGRLASSDQRPMQMVVDKDEELQLQLQQPGAPSSPVSPRAQDDDFVAVVVQPGAKSLSQIRASASSPTNSTLA